MTPPSGIEPKPEIAPLPQAVESTSRPPAVDRRISLERGIALIRTEAAALSGVPGVYRMIGARGEALYVGKARNLKRRVLSYAQIERQPMRLRRMIAETTALEFVTTHTEVEALLLESNLIKRLKPRYNVLLRDDKSFPFILLSGDHAFPQVSKHRGARNRVGEYFGPFASAGAVNRTITTLERAFLLRSCSDSTFEFRTRPCLLYQIKRCSAPCVGRISPEAYGDLVHQARVFLSGDSAAVQGRLSEAMQQASHATDFEAAAGYRDRIRALTQVQAHQDINVEGLGDADVIAAHQEGGQTAIQVFFFRGGANYGNRTYFPSHDKSLELDQVLSAFIGQFYDAKAAPPLVLISDAPAESGLLAEALSLSAGRRVKLLAPSRGAKRRLVEHARTNAQEALARRISESGSQHRLLEGVATAFGLETAPRRIEVYDNSHIGGRHAYGAMIVAGPEGLVKGAYRKFAIRGARGVPVKTAEGTAPDAGEGYSAGDDYAMLREVLTRRFTRAIKEDPERALGGWPDLLLIDGGQGQLTIACEVFAELGISDVALVAIAKGPDRNAGRERFFLPGRAAQSFDPKDPVLYFLQRLRDEAHRFAIGTHRAKRSRVLGQSILDEVPAIGATRKRALLHHFGSAASVARAGLADLEAVSGISKTVAKKVYDHFHGGT